MKSEENGNLGSDFTLGEILSGVKPLNTSEEQINDGKEPVKRWSQQDIDRLILETQRPPKKSEEPAPQADSAEPTGLDTDNRTGNTAESDSEKETAPSVKIDLDSYEVPREKAAEIPRPMESGEWKPVPSPSIHINKEETENFDIDLSEFDFPEQEAGKEPNAGENFDFDLSRFDFSDKPEEETGSRDTPEISEREPENAPGLRLYKQITGAFKIDFSSLEKEEPEEEEKPEPPAIVEPVPAGKQKENDAPETEAEPVPSANSNINFAATDIFARPSPPAFDKDIEPLSGFGEFSGGMETDEVRERFLSILEIEKTAEHDLFRPGDPIEKPGVILEKSLFSKTADLQPMPTVIPAEEIFRAQQKTAVNKANAVPSPAVKETNQIVDGQIVLTGFEQKENETEKVSETAAEDALLMRRQEKVKNFKLVGVPEEGESPYSPAESFETYENTGGEPDNGQGRTPARKNKKLEYRFTEQRNRVYKSIKIACKKTTFSVIALAAIELVFVLFMSLPFLLEAASVDSAAFAANSSIQQFISLILLMAAAFINLPCILSGYKSLLCLKPNSDAAAAFAVTFAAVQNLLVPVLPQVKGANIPVFSAAAVFVLLLNALGRRFSHACSLGNFEFCAFNSAQSLYSIDEIEDGNEAFEIGRGILMGNPEVLYSCKTGFPSEFIKNAREAGLADKISGFLFPVTAGVSLLTGIIAWILTKSFVQGLTALAGAMCLSVPACAALASSFLLRAANKKLNGAGAMIANWSAAEECSKSNAVVIDSADLFDRAHCEMHGMKDYKNVRIDDVILYTAAMIIKSGGPLTDVFDKVIVGRRELLPPVKSLSYEDRLGLTAWIHGQKVLLGNRNLLVHHDIEVPPKTSEERYKHDGRRVMYLAIANKIAAMFVVSYTADAGLLAYIKKLEDNGMQLLVRTCDANVTEELLTDCFDLPVNGVKVIGATAGRIFKRYKDKVKETAPARVLHDGRTSSLLKSITAASSLASGIRTAELIQIIGTGLGLLGFLLLVCLSSLKLADASRIILFQAFWAVLSLAAGRLKK